MLMDPDIKIKGNSEVKADKEKEQNIISENPDSVKTL